MEYNTACIRDLDKLNLIWRFDFRLEPISVNDQAGPNVLLTLKVAKCETKVINLLFHPRLKFLIHTLMFYASHYYYFSCEFVRRQTNLLFRFYIRFFSPFAFSNSIFL